MTRFIDKNSKAVAISMVDANGASFEADFFEIGSLKMDDNGAYIVDDVDYLVDYANSYANGTNADIDYEMDEDGEIILPNIDVHVEEI